MTQRGFVKALTASRLLAGALLVPAGLLEQWGFMSCVFVLALATDMVDGELARHLGVTSEAGKRLDSNADAALTGGALLGAALGGMISWWAPFVVLVTFVVAQYLLGVLRGDLLRLLMLSFPVVNLTLCGVLLVGFVHHWLMASYVNIGLIVLAAFMAVLCIKYERVRQFLQEVLH